MVLRTATEDVELPPITDFPPVFSPLMSAIGSRKSIQNISMELDLFLHLGKVIGPW